MTTLLQAVEYGEGWRGAWMWLLLVAVAALLIWAIAARTNRRIFPRQRTRRRR